LEKSGWRWVWVNWKPLVSRAKSLPAWNRHQYGDGDKGSRAQTQGSPYSGAHQNVKRGQSQIESKRVCDKKVGEDIHQQKSALSGWHCGFVRIALWKGRIGVVVNPNFLVPVQIKVLSFVIGSPCNAAIWTGVTYCVFDQLLKSFITIMNTQVSLRLIMDVKADRKFKDFAM
jgi:hypothetical protein